VCSSVDVLKCLTCTKQLSEGFQGLWSEGHAPCPKRTNSYHHSICSWWLVPWISWNWFARDRNMKQCIQSIQISLYNLEVRSTKLHNGLTHSIHMTVYDTPCELSAPLLCARLRRVLPWVKIDSCPHGVWTRVQRLLSNFMNGDLDRCCVKECLLW